MRSLYLDLLTVSVALIAAWGPGVSSLAATSAVQPEPPELEAATLLQRPRALDGFELTDHEGNRLTEERLTGRWTFVFMGYTHCPDVCPMTLSALDRLDRTLEGTDVARDTQYLFVSVDPRRDDPERLKTYVGHFNREFLGATGEPVALESLARELALPFKVPEEPRSEDYVVRHSGNVALIGPRGRLQAYLRPPHEPSAMTAAYREIRAYREAVSHPVEDGETGGRVGLPGADGMAGR